MHARMHTHTLYKKVGFKGLAKLNCYKFGQNSLIVQWPVKGIKSMKHLDYTCNREKKLEMGLDATKSRSHLQRQIP